MHLADLAGVSLRWRILLALSTFHGKSPRARLRAAEQWAKDNAPRVHYGGSHVFTELSAACPTCLLTYTDTHNMPRFQVVGFFSCAKSTEATHLVKQCATMCRHAPSHP
jgi:hypothetical protein